MRSLVAPFVLLAACGLVRAADVPDLLPELRYSDPASWIGQSREQILEKWGQPSRVKKQKDGGELIVFERSVLLGATYADASSAEIDVRKEKDDEGKSRLVAEPESIAPVDLVYKRMKFKFWFGAQGRVARVAFPRGLTEDPAGRAHAPPRGPSEGASPYSP